MKIKLDTIDGLPEGLKESVSEIEGGYELNLEGAVSQAKFEAKDNALSNERGKLEAWVKAFGKDPEATKAQFEALKNDKPKGKTDEDVNAMIEQALAPLKTENEALKGQIGDLRGKTVGESLKAELAKAGVLPEALDVVANFANSRIMFDDDGSMQIRAADGKPMVGSGENYTATLADLVGDVVKTMPFALQDAGKGGGGKPADSTGGKPNSQNSPFAGIKGFSDLPEK